MTRVPLSLGRPKKTPTIVRQEHHEQRDLFSWMLIAPTRHQAALSMAFAIPNFSGRLGNVAPVAAKRQGAKLKAEGRKRGVPDVFLPVPRGGSHGLFIEMKRANGVPSDVSPEQDAWHRALRFEGYSVAVCYGFEEARDAILKYLTHQEP